MLGTPIEGRHPHMGQEVLEASHAVTSEHADSGNVQRARERNFRRDGAAIAVVVILRHVAGILRGDIEHQALGENLAGVEHRGEQKRLQDASGAARPLNDVDGVASFATRGPGGVADIGEDLEVDVVDDDGGGVVDVLEREPASMLLHDRVRRGLYRWVDGGLEAMGSVAGSSAQRVQQVRSGLGEWQRLRRKRLPECELEVERIERPDVVELPQQTIAFREKLVAVSSRMDERGAIRKHRERGGLGP